MTHIYWSDDSVAMAARAAPRPRRLRALSASFILLRQIPFSWPPRLIKIFGAARSARKLIKVVDKFARSTLQLYVCFCDPGTRGRRGHGKRPQVTESISCGYQHGYQHGCWRGFDTWNGESCFQTLREIWHFLKIVFKLGWISHFNMYYFQSW